MKASLVWPQFSDFSGLDETWLQHGILQIATEANKNGHMVDILDGRVFKKDGVKQILADTSAEIVGISMLSSLVGFGKEIFDFLRKNRPDIKIVIGGIHPTVMPETFESWKPDWLIKGEGEITFSKILDGNMPEGTFDGEKPDLADLSPVDRKLVKLEEKPIGPGLEEPFATVIIGRGCPHSCTFCQPAERTLFGKKLRMRPVENVVEELKGLGIKSFMVHDDCFTASPSYVNEFCEAIALEGWTWWCQGRADDVVRNLSLIRKMRQAGLTGMIIGHESGDGRTLRAIKKGVTAEENAESIIMLKTMGIWVWSNIMLGLPAQMEPPSSVINTIRFVQQTEPHQTSVTIFTPHPGSYLYDFCAENDIILREPDDWTYFNRGRFEPKIKGVDVSFVLWAAEQIKIPEIMRARQQEQQMKELS